MDSGSDLVLEAVDSCLALTQGDDRPAGLEEAGQPASGTFQPFVSPMLCLDGYDCSRVVDHYLVLGFMLTCGSFDPCTSLSVHLIKPTSNRQLKGIVDVSHCTWIEDVALCVEVPGQPA